MARVVKVFRTLRNNWKKSTVAAALLTYGSFYARDKYSISQLMRAYCEEAEKYGEEPISVLSKPRHITVILNPAARDGKGKKLYEKYSAPLLNLSGMKVSVIQTEHEGQAKDLMSIMENTDAVIVAGGNGTLHEAVTGLLRRNDETQGVPVIPLGIAPIGKTNTVAKSLFWRTKMLDEQLVAEATMAVIREAVKPIDVIKVQGEKGQVVYSVFGLELGLFRDRNAVIKKYWYFGPLKKKMAYILPFKQPSPLSAELSFLLPCSGCSRCFRPVQKQKAESKRWWATFLPKTPSLKSEIPVRDFSNVTNEKCGIWHTKHIEFLNMAINATINLNKNPKEPFAMNVTTHPSDLTKLQIIQEGWKSAEEKRQSDLVESLAIQDAKLNILLPEEEERWYSIDDENYEVQNIEITLMPSKLNVFVNMQ